MSAREELFGAITTLYRPQYAPGEEESANFLLDAYTAEVRAETLREAAEILKILYGEYSSPQMQSAVLRLRRAAGTQ